MNAKYVTVSTALLLFCWAFIGTQLVAAAVFINELMPDPTATSDKSEWVELYNGSDASVDLTGWQLDSRTFPAIQIDPKGFVIVTKDSAAFAEEFGPISAVLQLDIGLTNSGDQIQLLDAAQNLVDQVSYTGSSPSISWERRSFGCDMLDPSSTGNSVGKLNANQDKPCQADTPISYSHNIQLSELYPAPDTAQGESEWVELYNNSDVEVDLGDWQLKDTTKIFKLPSQSIKPRQHLAITYLSISLNNDGEEIQLLSPDGVVVDKVTYPKAERQMSYIRLLADTGYQGDWQFTTTPTPGKSNILTLPVASPPVAKSSAKPKTVASVPPATVIQAVASASVQWVVPSLQRKLLGINTEDTTQTVVRISLWQIGVIVSVLVNWAYIWKSGLLSRYLHWWRSG